MKKPLQITVNGEVRQALVQPYYSLLDTLRDELHMTVRKRGAMKVIAAHAPFS